MKTFDSKVAQQNALDKLNKTLTPIRDALMFTLRNMDTPAGQDLYYDLPDNVFRFTPKMIKRCEGMGFDMESIKVLVEQRQAIKNTPVVKPVSKAAKKRIQDKAAQTSPVGLAIIKNVSLYFSEQRDDMIADYIERVCKVFTNMVTVYGSSFKGIYNSHNATLYKMMIRPNIKKCLIQGDIIDTVALNKNAARYADDIILAAAYKIAAKIGELDTMKFSRLGNYEFTVTGTHRGWPVMIKQNMILNFSKHCTPFNQYPAHITVDGVFMSEADYSKFMKK